jgi:hypothetical protein
MGEKDEGGLGSFLGKAEKWLRDQGVTHEALEEAKANRERWDTEEAAAREAKERAARETRVGYSRVTLRGMVSGTVDAGLAVETGRDEGSLMLKVESVDPVPLQGGTFIGFSLTVPNYRGPGTYDLATVDVTGNIYELSLQDEEEGFYWSAEYGPGIVKVSADETEAEVSFVYQDPGGRRAELDGVVQLA